MKQLRKISKKTEPRLAFEAAEHSVISFSKNYGSYLNLPSEWIQFIAKVANRARPEEENESEPMIAHSDKLWDGRSRASIAATIVYIVTRLPKCPEKVDMKMVIRCSDVCCDTIKSCYRDMLPIVPKLLENTPMQIATTEEICETF
jgi:transcription initiation factor TFIIIB Brf1 subunit/transcription initiation factor TFIIB